MNRIEKIIDRSRRAVEVMKWRASRLASKSANRQDSLDSRITFLIAHFNSPEFLSVCLHAIRKFHPDSHILVADATSEWACYEAAKKECVRFNATMWPLLIQHRHSGILNFLFRHAKTDFAVFLDQDCILLDRVDGLVKAVAADTLLAGAHDRMLVDYPLRSGQRSNYKPPYLRDFNGYVHASLMVLQPARIRARFGSGPFRWKKSFGSHHHEKYHGLSHQLSISDPGKMLLLDSIHSAYGLGMVYLHERKPIAYHNWYSGRVFKQEGTLDGLKIETLKQSMDRFLADYWANKLNFDLPAKPVVAAT